MVVEPEWAEGLWMRKRSRPAEMRVARVGKRSLGGLGVRGSEGLAGLGAVAAEVLLVLVSGVEFLGVEDVSMRIL